ncbi:hypothetical protein AB0J35_61295 [Nonomuraea angiospora]|uniref:hypothetical protein n=1 Tax=Nonomuraea angiospora TaxID=46172 RepID=UPI00344885D6
MRVAILGPLEADTDVGEFDRLTARARQHGDPAIRAALLKQALCLGRGAALGEEAFAAAFARGRDLDRARAVELVTGGAG